MKMQKLKETSSLVSLNNFNNIQNVAFSILLMLRKLLIISVGLLIIFVVVIKLISKNHPIILKWIVGSAKIIGKPINATVYTNGQINNDIKVYHINKYWDGGKANNYLLNLKEFDSQGKLKFINIDLKNKWIGRPIGTAKDDYDFINEVLFQSDVGGHFADFRDDMKGYDFNPQLTFTDRQIKFNIPPNQLKFDSIRIELKK